MPTTSELKEKVKGNPLTRKILRSPRVIKKLHHTLNSLCDECHKKALANPMREKKEYCADCQDIIKTELSAIAERFNK